MVRRPVLVLVVAVAGLGALALPATKLEPGPPGEGTMAADTTQRKAYDLLSDSFGPGFNGPLTVTVEGEDAAAAGDKAGAALKRNPGVAPVSGADANEAGDTAILASSPRQARPTPGPNSSSGTSAPRPLRSARPRGPPRFW